MKKLYSISIAIILSILSFWIFNCVLENLLTKNIDKTICNNNDERNKNDYVMGKIINNNSIVVLGSSELYSSDNLAYPPFLYNYGNSNYNTILIGRGNMQSLHHAISLGALQNNIKNNKVVLIVSPQWFTKDHLSSAAYSSRFIESNYVEFLKNKNISKKTKDKVSNRLNTLLVEDKKELGRINKYESIYLNYDINPLKYIEMNVYDYFINIKNKFTYYRSIKNLDNYINYDKYVKSEDIDYQKLLKEAIIIGNKECTNNDFGINNDYFNRYVYDNLKKYKDSSINGSYSDSIEYDDFRIFLDVCKDIGIEPLIISIPVNGAWYDYIGFSKEKRREYYQNIRDICSEYNVEIADFSNNEYEKYFLKDIMHLGWKGWVYVDEAIYNFYRK